MKTLKTIKTLALLAGVCVAILLAAGCGNEKDVAGNGNKPSTPQEESLANTKWKLVGIVNAETGEIKELEPKDCEECYTLTFDKEYTAIAHSIIWDSRVDLLNLNPPEIITDDLRLELYEKDGEYYTGGDQFHKAILCAESYVITSEELKLYFARGEYYLLFKPFKEIRP